jgi:hypothetical protein
VQPGPQSRAVPKNTDFHLRADFTVKTGGVNAVFKKLLTSGILKFVVLETNVIYQGFSSGTLVTFWAG